jgi:hypothetical protein
MTWWQAYTLARAGRPVRRPAWGNAQRIVFDVDNLGGVRAVAVIEMIAPDGRVTRRVVQAADFGPAEFGAVNWEVVPDA